MLKTTLLTHESRRLEQKEGKRERERDGGMYGEEEGYECVHGIWSSKYATWSTIILSVVNEYREGYYTDNVISYSEEFMPMSYSYKRLLNRKWSLIYMRICTYNEYICNDYSS